MQEQLFGLFTRPDFPVSDPIFHDPTLNLIKFDLLLPLLPLTFDFNQRQDLSPSSVSKATKKDKSRACKSVITINLENTSS